MKKSWLIISLWGLALAATLLWAVSVYPFTPTFPYYQLLSDWPRGLSTLGNFDGVNYLRIARAGYPESGGEVAFFPLYPILIRLGLNLGLDPFLSALAISWSSLLLFFWVIHRHYKIALNRFLALFLSFPASFFLVAAYTESLFLVMYALCIALIKARRWWLAALIAGLASGTRLVGAIFGLLLVYEYLRTRSRPWRLLPLLLLSELGLLAYMYYLTQSVGDPLAFIHVQPQFGMGRSGGDIVLLPQVLYRYARMITTAVTFDVLLWRVVWELVTFLGVLYALIKYWSKLDWIDRLYCAWIIFLPTFSGTLSSFPRYALTALPLFFVLAKQLRPVTLTFLITGQILILIYQVVLFARGLFVA